MYYDTGWSALARILPYMEGNPLFNAANLGVCKEDPANSTIISLTVTLSICPSEVKPQVSSHDYGLAGVDQLRDEPGRLVRLGRVQRAV